MTDWLMQDYPAFIAICIAKFIWTISFLHLTVCILCFEGN